MQCEQYRPALRVGSTCDVGLMRKGRTGLGVKCMERSRRATDLVLVLCCSFSAMSAARDIEVPQSSVFAETWSKKNFDHTLWTEVLSEHVDGSGMVDYAAIGQDSRFREYLYRLANTNPAELPDSESRLAFWINAYNALAIQGVVETLPDDVRDWPAYSVLRVSVPGVREKGKGFFTGLRFVVGRRRYTLDEIEKAVILQNPSHTVNDKNHYRAVGPARPDPRVHFALVCCAKGCPKLRREPYAGSRLETQLAIAVKMFLRDPAKARFDAGRRTMHVSQLLDWYKSDFTDRRMSPSAPTVAAFLSRYVDDRDLAQSLANEKWSASYIDYDWKLNLQR